MTDKKPMKPWSFKAADVREDGGGVAFTCPTCSRRLDAHWEGSEAVRACQCGTVVKVDKVLRFTVIGRGEQNVGIR